MSTAPPNTAAALLAGAVVGLLLALLSPVSASDLSTLDRWQVGVPQGPSHVAIIDIDDRSALTYGWPVDPEIYAAIADVVTAQGAKSVGVDVLLSGDPLAPARPSDEVLRDTAKSIGLVLGTEVTRKQSSTGAALPPSGPSALSQCAADPASYVLPLRKGVQGTRIAHLAAPPIHADGVYRAVTPCLSVHDGCIPSLSYATTGTAPTSCVPELVPYSRDFDDFPRVTLYDLVERTATPEGLAEIREVVDGRHVLIGASAQSVADLGRTPAAALEPLVSVHANLSQALAEGRSIRAVSRRMTLLAGLILAVVFVTRRWSARLWLVISAGIFLDAYLLSWVAFRAADLWIQPLALALPLSVGALASAGHQGWRQLRYNQMLTQAFGKYVSPDVLDWLQSTGGEALSPSAAERREVTVMFTDIVGYTKLSNRLPTEDVLRSLRLYLQAMIPIIQKHGGYLDKINGDGLMVLFGAPRPLDDAAQAGLDCAEEMHAEVQRMKAEWKDVTDGELKVRIGLATGPAFVGNLGGEGHVEYTAIGPVVNLSARLEPKAPHGGITLCERTHAALTSPPTGAWVSLDLKGYAPDGGVRAWEVPPR
ncbi:MAG: adenylate/guanylate cyclase domain-containing protein [Proteobacteria bacterium]|nr:adenylate/guanylate cyclase domain-containing protein [Pseudomonadota bacterium]